MSLFGMKGDSNSCIKLMFSKIDMVLNCFLRAWIFFTKVCMIVTKTKYIWFVLNLYKIGWFALVPEN